MYKIYVDNELIWANTTPDAGITSAKISLQTNSEQSFEYTVAKDYPAYNKYKMMTSVIDIYQDNETDPIFEGRPIKEAVDFYGTKTITCEGALGYLNDSIQRPHDYTGQSISSILKALLDVHNQQVEDYKKIYLGNVTVVDTTDEKIYSGGTSSSTTTNYYNLYPTNSDTTGTSGTTLTTDYVSTYEAITNLLVNNLAGYLNIRYEDGKKYLDYLKEYLPNEGQTILFGSNMLDLSSTLDYTNICTGVLPLGYSQTSEANDAGLYPSSSTTSTSENKLTITSVNGGSDILWNIDAVNNFGRIIKKVEWSNVKDANTLKEKANNYLTNTQYDNLTLDCKIVDLHFVDKNVTPLHFLHMVRVVSKPHGMDREFPISSMEIDLMSPANDTVTLGQTYNSISGKMAGAETSISSTRNDISNIQTTVNNNSTTNWTNITKTNDNITLEAHERQKSEDELHGKITSEYDAALKITANNISSMVSENQKKNDETFASYNSRINQTAHDISTEVAERKKGDDGLELSIKSVARQTPTSFSWGFEDAGGGKESLVLYKNTDDGTVGYKVDLDEFIMNVLKRITITTPRIDINTGPSNSSTIQNGIISTTNQMFGKQFIAMSDPSSTSSGGTGTATMYGQSTIKHGTISGGTILYDREIRMDSEGYDESGNIRKGIRFNCDIFCGANQSMVATRKWVTENFKDGYIKKSAVGVNTTIHGDGVESKYPTYAQMRDRKNQLVGMVKDLRSELSDYKSSHSYSNSEYNNKTATVNTTITGSGVEDKYPTYAQMRDRKNTLVDWVKDLRAQVRAGCKKGTTPVH